MINIPEGTLRQVSWGFMTIQAGNIQSEFAPELTLKDSPNHPHCQCPHWGYVLKGRMRLKYPDHEEVYQAGDVYYAAPSHITYFEAGCEYVEFSPTLELNKAKDAAQESMSTQK
jgi:hypothetical protein